MMAATLCHHCRLPIPAGDEVEAEVAGERRLFCCNGCLGVYRLIHEEGLGEYYQRREEGTTGLRPREGAQIAAEAFAESTRQLPGDAAEIDLVIDGIHCSSCVWLNERLLARTPGVEAARVSYATHVARIRWRPQELSLGELLGRIASAGYLPRPWEPSRRSLARRAEERDLLVRFGTAAFLSSQLMLYTVALYAGYFQGMDPGLRRLFEGVALVLAAPVLLYSGASFYRGAWRALRAGGFNMDSLVVLGATSAFVFSVLQMFRGGEVYFDTAAMIVTLLVLGRYLESIARGKVSAAIDRLAELLPRRATVVGEDGEEERVRLEEVRPGALLRVTPGERVPLDGEVVEGSSEVDESLLTGEPIPVPKTPGREVIGGSQNLYGTMLVRALRPVGESAVARIARAVEEAQEHKPRVQRVADRIVGWFVPAVLLLAAATVVGHRASGQPLAQSFLTGVSVLVIACPCALGLATPLAVLVFSGTAARLGVLVRRGEVLEALPGATDVVLDKTGTVTLGRPDLRQVVPLVAGESGERLLAVAAAVESGSEHALGRALVRAARRAKAELRLEVASFEAVPGLGVRARVSGLGEDGVEDRGVEVRIGNRSFLGAGGATVPASAEVAAAEGEGATAVFVAWDGAVRGVFLVADAIREEAPQVVAALAARCPVALVSGDHPATTGAVARRLGITRVEAGVTPQGKAQLVREMQARGRRVMMVGDGINDAPALTEAAVGVAMGRGTDVTVESADAVLARDDLTLLPRLVALGDRCLRVVRQNLFWAFFYNLVAVPLAIAGMLHPIVAAAAMAASSLLVVLNSLRVGRLPPTVPGVDGPAVR